MGFWTTLASLGAMGGGALVGGPIGMGLIGAGIGGAKSSLIDDPKRARANELAAQTARYSPWTRLNSQNVQIPNVDPIGSGLQFGLTGYGLGQNYQNYQAGQTGTGSGKLGTGWSALSDLSNDDTRKLLASYQNPNLLDTRGFTAS